MTPSEQEVSLIVHAIQLAVAPVFLLTGLGAMLAVMTNRLSRVVDRARRELLAASRLAHQAEGLPGADGEVDPVDRLHRAEVPNQALGNDG